MGFFDKIRLSSALRAVGRAAKYIHDGIVGTIKNVNPLLRMYYDSDLGSPIEGHVEKSLAASTCNALKKMVPNWKWAKNMCDRVGTWIAHKSVQALDTSKVVYQASNGTLKTDPYSEIAKRTTAGLFGISKILCRAGHGIGWLTGKISEWALPDGVNVWVKKGLDIAIGETLRGVRRKVFSDKNKERVTKFAGQGMRVAVTATRGIIDYIDTAADKAKDAVKKTVGFLKDVADKVGEKVQPFKEKVLETARNIGSAARAIGKKIWNFLTGRK